MSRTENAIALTSAIATTRDIPFTAYAAIIDTARWLSALQMNLRMATDDRLPCDFPVDIAYATGQDLALAELELTNDVKMAALDRIAYFVLTPLAKKPDGERHWRNCEAVLRKHFDTSPWLKQPKAWPVPPETPQYALMEITLPTFTSPYGLMQTVYVVTGHGGVRAGKVTGCQASALAKFNQEVQASMLLEVTLTDGAVQLLTPEQVFGDAESAMAAATRATEAIDYPTTNRT